MKLFNFIQRKKRFFLSRKKRLEATMLDQKNQGLGISFSAPIANAKNIPSEYAKALFGRPFRKVHFSFTHFLAIFAFIVLILYILFFSVVFRVKKINLVNNHVLLEEDVVKFLEERNIYEKNIFLLNAGQLKTVLMDYYKRVEDVRVFKVVPNKLRIKIREKPSTVLWVTQERRYLLDQDGRVLGEATGTEENMPIVVDRANIAVAEQEQIVTRSFIDFVNTVDETLRRRFGLGVVSYSINNTTFELRVHINSGFYIVFDTTQDAAIQFEKLAKLYEHGDVIREYVILAIEGKVIVK